MANIDSLPIDKKPLPYDYLTPVKSRQKVLPTVGMNAPTAHRNQKMAGGRWQMIRDEDHRANKPFLEWWVNPSECQWKVGTRTMIEKVGGGAIHHEWPQLGGPGYGTTSFSGSRFDQPVLSLTFQSGIVTVGGYNDVFTRTDNTAAAPPGLGNYFDFLALIEKSNIQENGYPNYVNIAYKSLIFGDKGIWLKGFFDEGGVSWTDSAENPNQIASWGASFIVYDSAPELSKLRSCFTTLGIINTSAK